jgi:hypothetical protein
MKKFIRQIILFFLPVILIFLLTEYAVTTVPNSHKLKGDYLRNKASTIETLILGSSHTFYGVNPNYFSSNTFNASNVSQSPDIDLAILKTYEDSLINLGTVVIRLSYDTLFEQLKNSSEDWRLKDYKIYSEIKFDYAFKHNFELLSAGPSRCMAVLINYYFKNESLLNCNVLGWGNDLQQKPPTNLNQVGKLVAEKHTAKTWDLLDDNITIFKALIEWCQKRNVKVIIVTPPAYKSYREHLSKNQLNKMIQVGYDLSLNSRNCVYYNLIDDKSFIATDFFDPDHLNKRGAQKLSLFINGLISQPLK